MPHTLYTDPTTRFRAMRHARGDYQRRLLAGTESWIDPGGQWSDGYARSRATLLRRLRAAGYRCAPALLTCMAISRDEQDLRNLLSDLRDGSVGQAA